MSLIWECMWIILPLVRRRVDGKYIKRTNQSVKNMKLLVPFLPGGSLPPSASPRPSSEQRRGCVSLTALQNHQVNTHNICTAVSAVMPLPLQLSHHSLLPSSQRFFLYDQFSFSRFMCLTVTHALLWYQTDSFETNLGWRRNTGSSTSHLSLSSGMASMSSVCPHADHERMMFLIERCSLSVGSYVSRNDSPFRAFKSSTIS